MMRMSTTGCRIRVTLAISASFASLAPSLTASAASGDVNRTFGDHGRIIYVAPGQTHTSPAHFFQQADGKTVVIGSEKASTNSPTSALVARFNEDGSLDPTFGTGGRVELSESGNFVTAQDGIQLASGKFLVVGSRLWRLNADGTRDSSFGTNGTATSPIVGVGVFSLEDETILVAGTDFQFAHFSSSGVLDSTFGQNGVASIDVGGYRRVNRTLRQSDGRIVAVGYSGASPAEAVAQTAVRVNIDGSLDTGFGSGGRIISTCSNCAWNGVTQQPDGKLLLSGYSYEMSSGSAPPIRQNTSLVERRNVDGTPDVGFGVNGRRTSIFNNINSEPIHVGEIAAATAVDPLTGAIFALGTLTSGMYSSDQSADSWSGNVAVIRLRADGSVDPAFGRNGISIVPFARPPLNYNFYGLEIARLSDGQLLTLADLSLNNSFNANSHQVGLAKLLQDGGDPGVLSVVAPGRVTESIGTAVFRVLRRGGSSGSVSVSYATVSNFIPAVSANPGSDYTPVMGTITWADGDREPKDIVVPIIADSVIESVDKMFSLTLSNPTGGAEIDTASVSLQIARDDVAPFTSISISQAPIEVSDAQSAVSISVTRTGTATVSVNFFTHSRTAEVDSDFTPVTGLLAWGTNDTTPRTITIPIKPNAAVTGPKSFDIILANATPGTALGGTTATVTIVHGSAAASPPSGQNGGSNGGGGRIGWGAILLLAIAWILRQAQLARVTASAMR